MTGITKDPEAFFGDPKYLGGFLVQYASWRLEAVAVFNSNLVKNDHKRDFPSLCSPNLTCSSPEQYLRSTPLPFLQIFGYLSYSMYFCLSAVHRILRFLANSKGGFFTTTHTSLQINILNAQQYLAGPGYFPVRVFEIDQNMLIRNMLFHKFQTHTKFFSTVFFRSTVCTTTFHSILSDSSSRLSLPVASSKSSLYFPDLRPLFSVYSSTNHKEMFCICTYVLFCYLLSKFTRYDFGCSSI